MLTWVSMRGQAVVCSLGSVRKVLPQASQRASQRDHCGKTPGELVVTGDNSPVFF